MKFKLLGKRIEMSSKQYEKELSIKSELEDLLFKIKKSTKSDELRKAFWLKILSIYVRWNKEYPELKNVTQDRIDNITKILEDNYNFGKLDDNIKLALTPS